MKKTILKIIYKILNKIPEDVNDDGMVDSQDLFLVKKYLLTKESDINEKN
jgi:hypothetical protein